ncbi:MAG: DUF2199 domain-containing protein [Anaerolineae bacterium]|nr:DUF2199 domain-containing protein [Anaerolineae bacterium]
MQRYQCATCGKYHDGIPLHYGAPVPAYYLTIPKNEQAKRCFLSSDQCVIDEEFFFIVGNINIPIIGSEEVFSWDVWVSLSKPNYERACHLWEQPGRESEPPYFGWLSTNISVYPDTLGLKTMVHTREVGRRPFIELEPTDHPLAVEQRTGMTWERVQQIAERVLHS